MKKTELQKLKANEKKLLKYLKSRKITTTPAGFDKLTENIKASQLRSQLK